jgi:hypothetical protein
MLFLSSSLFGQMGTLQVRTDITSGIITPIDSLHEIGLVQFQVTGLTEEMQSLILKEYLKYEGEIVNCGFDITDDKLIQIFC